MAKKMQIIMRKIVTFTIAAILLLSLGTRANAQESSAFTYFSPYSLFGLGVLETDGSENSLAMGGVGIADRNNMIINLHNPAAVTAREEKSFMIDFGLSQKNIYYKDSKASGVNNTFNLHHLAISFPIYKSSAFKIGIKQYSSTGYSFVTNETNDELIATLGDIKYTQDGKGGIYQAFFGGGVTFWKRLSIGVDGQFYFGKTDRYSGVYFTTSSVYRTILRGWKFVPRGFGATFGIQYEQPLAKDMSITLGGTFKIANSLKGENTEYVYGTATSATDTLMSQVTTAAYNTPFEWGAGISVRKNSVWSVGVDFSAGDWTSSKFPATPGINFATARAMSINAGFEYTPNRYDIRYYMKRVTYRGGVYHTKSYMSLNGRQINSTGFTVGMSFPVFNRGTSLSFGLDFGQMGTLSDNLVRERYFKINVGLNLFDIWFQKSLYN